MLVSVLCALEKDVRCSTMVVNEATFVDCVARIFCTLIDFLFVCLISY